MRLLAEAVEATLFPSSFFVCYIFQFRDRLPLRRRYHFTLLYVLMLKDCRLLHNKFIHSFHLRQGTDFTNKDTVKPRYNAPVYNIIPQIEHKNFGPKKYFYSYLC